ncbi:MAG TPA: protein kinase, partial [Acidobacteriota bacterium]|nr:protein kinase [Acidobacteriota bacterium]
PLPWAEAATLAMQAAAGLSEAHAHGIVHRDIKPANLFLTSKGQLKLLDFGLAKLTGASVLTKSGSTMGTAAYMSPEQVAGGAAEAQSDVWSLGVVLYEMVSGRTPFAGDYAQAVMYGILNEAPVPLEKLGIAAPAALQEILTKSLVKRPEERYASAEELGRALAACLGPEESAAVLALLRPARVRRRWLVPAVVAAALFLAIIGVLAWRGGWWPFPATAPLIRLAVLPLANLSGDPEQEYLSDGLTQELINQLGRLHPATLSVIARTSIMRYKKSDKGVDQIGRELNVDYVLEGSAQREGSRIRITAELIRVGDQAQLWADSFDQEMAGILVLQSDVAKKVAGALALKLLPAEAARLAKVRSVNPEAYEAYLKGLQYWYKFTPAGVDSAQQYLQLALKKDPAYAPAYAGIALVWAGRQQMGVTPPGEAAPKARAAARRAVELDESVAEAHYALAIVNTWSDWDWAAGQQEFRRAIALNPGFPDARIYYSHLLVCLGHQDEAIVEGARAIELDPYNPLFHSLYSGVLIVARRPEEAAAQARLALRTNPNDGIAWIILWIYYSQKGMYRKALPAVKNYLKSYNVPEVEAAMDRAFAAGGFRAAMRAGAAALEARAKKSFVCPTDIANVYVSAGEKDRALEWLEKAYEIHDPNLPYLRLPLYDVLRSDPRFQALARRMNLPVDGKK